MTTQTIDRTCTEARPTRAGALTLAAVVAGNVLNWFLAGLALGSPIRW